MGWKGSGVTGSVNATPMTTGPAAGITGGTGAICVNAIEESGNIVTTKILIDLTGLASSTTDLDIIGVGTSAAYIGSLLAAESGVIWGNAKMTCLEVPVGGITDIDLYEATEATGVFDSGIAALAETALITAGGAWTLGLAKLCSATPTAGKYIYLTGGAAGTAATYTAGQFLFEVTGYLA